MNRIFASSLVIGGLAVVALAVSLDSGLKVGETVTPFHPRHVSGPHKGTTACPPCTYGNKPQVQAWINYDDPANVDAIVKLLDESVTSRGKAGLKTFVIHLTNEAKIPEMSKKLVAYADSKGYDQVAIAVLPSNDEAVDNYKINVTPDVKNTIIVYKNRKVEAKFVNLKADAKGLGELSAAIDGITK